MADLAPVVGDPATATRAQLQDSIAAMVGHDRFPMPWRPVGVRRDNAVVRVYDELATKRPPGPCSLI